MKNADMPAMPIASNEHATHILKGNVNALQLAGLTKREYFATMAMQGLCASASGYGDTVGVARAAAKAVCCADALLKELEETK